MKRLTVVAFLMAAMQSHAITIVPARPIVVPRPAIPPARPAPRAPTPAPRPIPEHAAPAQAPAVPWFFFMPHPAPKCDERAKDCKKG